jgi:hypothetical protein
LAVNERHESNSEQVVVRWKMKNGRRGKTAPMSRIEAEHLVRELARRLQRMGFEIG